MYACCGAPVPRWPGPWRWIAGGLLVLAVALSCWPSSRSHPKYGALAAVVGVVASSLRSTPGGRRGRPHSLLIVGLAALIIRRQLRYHLVANPSWPAAFDDLHRLGLLVVVLLLASTLVDECPADQVRATILSACVTRPATMSFGRGALLQRA